MRCIVQQAAQPPVKATPETSSINKRGITEARVQKCVIDLGSKLRRVARLYLPFFPLALFLPIAAPTLKLFCGASCSPFSASSTAPFFSLATLTFFLMSPPSSPPFLRFLLVVLFAAPIPSDSSPDSSSEASRAWREREKRGQVPPQTTRTKRRERTLVLFARSLARSALSALRLVVVAFSIETAPHKPHQLPPPKTERRRRTHTR